MLSKPLLIIISGTMGHIEQVNYPLLGAHCYHNKLAGISTCRWDLDSSYKVFSIGSLQVNYGEFGASSWHGYVNGKSCYTQADSIETCDWSIGSMICTYIK